MGTFIETTQDTQPSSHSLLNFKRLKHLVLGLLNKYKVIIMRVQI